MQSFFMLVEIHAENFLNKIFHKIDNSKVIFLGKVMHEYQPLCVLCKIEPHKPAV